MSSILERIPSSKIWTQSRSFIQQKAHLCLPPCSLNNTLNRPYSAWESFDINQAKTRSVCFRGDTHISNLPAVCVCLRDCWQITFVTLNEFCPLSKRNPLPPVLNGKYQDRKNTNQNQMKNACHFHIGFQVLKVLLIKICKIQPLAGSFLSCFY